MKKKLFRKLLILCITTALGAILLPYFKAKHRYLDQEEQCWSSLVEIVNSKANIDSLLSRDINHYQSLIEWSLVVRGNMLAVATEIHQDTVGPISSHHLEVLKSGTLNCLELRDSLYEIALKYECAMEADSVLLAQNGISLKQKNKAVFMSISAALTLYDNYLLGAMIFERDKRLRRLLNDPDKGFGIEANKLAEITLTASSIEKQRRIQKGLEYFKDNSSNSADDELRYLQNLISSSPSYAYMQNTSLLDMTARRFKVFGRLSRDGWADLRNNGFGSLSKFFGNSVGLVETRKGKMFGNDSLTQVIKSELQPMDILLEKTPFRLTDKLIPGHFGHVAIWIGEKQDLEEIGIWTNEVVSKYHNEIDGNEHKCVVEALRNGVQLSTLDHFLNIDDFAVLRPVFSGPRHEQQVKEALVLALRQVGKEYDFNFDVNTTDKIVCSELAYISYPMINWETEETFGRYTISPDNVAKKCLDGQTFELITFYHNGTEVKEEKQLILFEQLLEEEIESSL